MSTAPTAPDHVRDAMTPEAAPGSPLRPRRAVALDALRGLAILMMVFSGAIPFDQPLPAWMYHAQEPPPAHVTDLHLAGLTWVDLVFPLFLFCLGAAIPLAFTPRLDKGVSWWKAGALIGQRGFLLAWFAVYFAHIQPHALAVHPHTRQYLASLLGFVLFFPMLTRLPAAWPRALYWAVRLVGWGGAFGLLAALSRHGYADGTGFRLDRNDIILIVLTDMAAFGSGLWLLTRRHLLARLGVLPLFLALRLSQAGTHGWENALWHWTPADWLFQWSYLKYLCLVLPGTVAGDLLLTWLRAPHGDAPAWPTWRRGALAALAFAVMGVLLAGLQSRTHLALTTAAAGGLALLALALTRRPAGATERLVQSLTQWGAYWLALGLMFEPFEGGIRKENSSFSYYFVTLGVALFLLAALTLLTESGRVRLRLLAGNGQNPMIAYVAMNVFLQPLLALTGLNVVLNRWLPGAWPGVLLGALETLVIALFVLLCTRARIYWRT